MSATYRGFDPEFLRQFAKDAQARADLLQSQARKAQQVADSARKELRRRKRAAGAT